MPHFIINCAVAPPTITQQPDDVTIQALQDATFSCEAGGFEVKYEWKRHNSISVIGRQPNFTISRATPSDEDQYYCVAMTKGGYAFSNNVTLTVNGKKDLPWPPGFLKSLSYGYVCVHVCMCVCFSTPEAVNN